MKWDGSNAGAVGSMRKGHVTAPQPVYQGPLGRQSSQPHYARCQYDAEDGAAQKLDADGGGSWSIPQKQGKQGSTQWRTYARIKGIAAVTRGARTRVSSVAQCAQDMPAVSPWGSASRLRLRDGINLAGPRLLSAALHGASCGSVVGIGDARPLTLETLDTCRVASTSRLHRRAAAELFHEAACALCMRACTATLVEVRLR